MIGRKHNMLALVGPRGRGKEGSEPACIDEAQKVAGALKHLPVEMLWASQTAEEC